MTAKHEVIYRQKDQGKGYPKMGKPENLLPGDYVSFFCKRARHTREVASVHKGYVQVKPSIVEYGGTSRVLHKGRKVLWKDIVSATRLLTQDEYTEMLYLEANPPPPPPPPDPQPAKKSRRGRRPETTKPPTKTEVMDLWAMLNT